MKIRDNETLVAEGHFVLANGTKVTAYIVDDENTVRDPEGVAQCIKKMKETAANIFARAEIAGKEKGA